MPIELPDCESLLQQAESVFRETEEVNEQIKPQLLQNREALHNFVKIGTELNGKYKATQQSYDEVNAEENTNKIGSEEVRENVAGLSDLAESAIAVDEPEVTHSQGMGASGG